MPNTYPGDVIFTEADVQVGVNAAASLQDMQRYASIVPKMSGLNDLEDTAKISMMLYAWRRINMLRFCVKDFVWTDADGKERTDICLTEMGATEFANLPAAMKEALAISTVIIAVEDAKCDSSELQAREGVLSTKSGETSTTYRLGAPRTFPLPRLAMETLSPYLCSYGELKIRRSS